MQSKINIVISVDVVGALSSRSLKNNIWLMDNSIYSSTGRGTENLRTWCYPGQIIQWNLHAVDVQTPASIRNITFVPTDDYSDFLSQGYGRSIKKFNNHSTVEELHKSFPQQTNDVNLEIYDWTGVVPTWMKPSTPYSYMLELQMGKGPNSIMNIFSPSLMRI